MRTLDYNTYLDKVWGCFLGKTVSGTLGAPYEGVKMPMELSFSPDMIDSTLPNDDLDLQILWLDVVERLGAGFTSRDLQKRFCEYCDYSPGEYAVMRKNYAKRIYPPYSGSFCNDFYRQGMGCPIRSEIWACLSPGDPRRASEFAARDGVLDHDFESVYAERFFAALEAEAFFSSDIYYLIDVGLNYIPNDCKFRSLVLDTVALCREYGAIKPVLRGLLFKYGHPDCTNMFQNMGITLASLILNDYDIIKTSMAALNCGFDTDCTCASAGSVAGIVKGAKAMMAEYGLTDVRYVLSVRSDRRSDKVYELCEDICLLGASPEMRSQTVIKDAPEKEFNFEKPEIEFNVEYEGQPSVSFSEGGKATLRVKNNGENRLPLSVRLKCDYPLVCSGGSDLILDAGGEASLPVSCSVAADANILPERNIIAVAAESGERVWSFSFGFSGAKRMRFIGPIWKTEPYSDEKLLEGKKGYWHLFPQAKNEGEMNDIVRGFHLNFAVDTETEYISPDEAFHTMETGFAGKYAVADFDLHTDSFRLDDISPFAGPCVFYAAERLFSPEEMTVCIQFGCSSPFALYINGEIAAERKTCDTWTSENVHLTGIKLKKGENRVLMRLTKVNGDAKYSLIFSKGPTCAEHYVCFSTGRFGDKRE